MKNKTGVAPGKMAQYYALMAWNGMDPKEAEALVHSKTYEELEELAFANSSVVTAKKGIEKRLLVEGGGR